MASPSNLRIKERELISWSELSSLYDFDTKATASGGFGAIYLGRKKETQEEVVLKTVNIQGCTSRRYRRLTPELCEELKKYIIREWDALSNLSHPNIVSAKDEYIYKIKDKCRCGADHEFMNDKRDDIFIIVMERMDRDIYDTMHFFQAYRQSPTRLRLTSFNQLKNSRLPPKLARRIFYQIAKALDYLHEKPILHRDISWGNIMLKQDPVSGRTVAKLVDLGLSRDMPRTQSGLSIENIGTVAFCAPELHYSELKTCGYGTRVDVWSLGVVLYLMLTGNSDANERSLRFRDMIDAIESDHDLCIEARNSGRNNKTCMFCYEVMNDRFKENISPQELQVKKDALSLLEGMLEVIADERMSIRQVLRHEWLEAERQKDPDPVDTEEETVLLSIPRPHGRPELQLIARKFEYPYLKNPDCAILASSYRDSARSVSLGDVTTFGGVLSRLGVASGERFLQSMPPFQPDDYIVPLDDCVPRRCRDKFFKHAYLFLLDHPNDRRSVYRVYKAMRKMHLLDSRCVIMPLMGFDFRFEEGSVYTPILGDTSRRKFVLQQWLSYAFYLARTTPVEVLALLSWKHVTYTVVKETLGASSSKPFIPSEIFDDRLCQGRFARQGESIQSVFEASPLAHEAALQSTVSQLVHLLTNLRYEDATASVESERHVCQAAGVMGNILLKHVVEGERGGKLSISPAEDREEVYFSLLTLQSMDEKLMMEGGQELITRVDVSRSLDSLEYVLTRVVESSSLPPPATSEPLVKEMSY